MRGTGDVFRSGDTGAEQRDAFVDLWVRDNGRGVGPEDLPHVFERLYRGRSTRAGSGLGLAIVQSIVHAHGVAVKVESKPDVGSWFVIQMPQK